VRRSHREVALPRLRPSQGRTGECLSVIIHSEDAFMRCGS